MRASSARVVDPAIIPVVPVSPNLILNLGLGMLAGLFCGSVGVVVRFRSDLRIQSPRLLEVQLNVRELGVIPAAAIDPAIRALLASPRGRSTSIAPNGSGGGNGG